MNETPQQAVHRTAGGAGAGWWDVVLADLRARWAAVRREPDAGYSTETVVVTGLLVVAALVVVAIIVAKVTEAANGISLVGG
ncbi:MAG: hypothetical protein L0H64_22335 [Pseudonocardia sp.]|nr:hypothetical protein [Pseudonocardia sp.]